MTAMSFDFGPADRVARSYKRLVLAVDDAVAVLSLGVAAGAIGCTPSALRDTLDGRNGCRLSAEWAAVVAERVGGGAYRDAIQAAIRDLFGIHEVEPDKDYIHRLEGGYLRFGAVGESELARHRRESRR